MGAGQSNESIVTKEEIEACTKVSSNYTASKGSIKKILKKLKNRSLQEASSPEELLEMLRTLNYFEMLFKDLKKKKKEYCKSVNEIILREALENESYQLEVAKMFYKLFDKDHNGVISLSEFVSGYVAYTTGSEAERQSVLFDLWDIDGNGTLSREEIASMWKINCECQHAFRKVTLTASIVASINAKLGNSSEGQQRTRERINVFLSEIMKVISQCFDEIFTNYVQNEQTIVEYLFSLADENGDGVISKEEFINYSVDPNKQQMMETYLGSLSSQINQKMLQSVQDIGNRIKELGQ